MNPECHDNSLWAVLMTFIMNAIRNSMIRSHYVTSNHSRGFIRKCVAFYHKLFLIALMFLWSLGQQVDSVGQHGEDTFQALFNRFGAARQVDNQGVPACSRHAA